MLLYYHVTPCLLDLINTEGMYNLHKVSNSEGINVNHHISADSLYPHVRYVVP